MADACRDSAQQRRLVYERLPSPSSIRVLRLYPGESHEALRCSLSVLDLDADHPPYIALSSVWGQIENPSSIECDGQEIHITSNLASVLHRIRDMTSPGSLWIDALAITIWVDALCIDQLQQPESLREREQQVQMMGNIYKSAKYVIVDLGDRSEDFDGVLPIVKRFNAVPDSIWNSAFKSQDLMLLPDEIHAFTSAHPFWKKFSTFVARAWFRRVWIVQEFVLAPKVTFLIGNQEFGASFISRVFDRTSDFLTMLTTAGDVPRPWIRRVGEILRSTPQLFHQRTLQQPDASNTLLKLLETYMCFEATDPRDRVYALFSLAEDVDKSVFPVDYSINADELSIRLAHFLVEKGHGGYLLAHADGLADHRPSWSWNLEIPKEFLDVMGRGVSAHVDEKGLSDLYSACGRTGLIMECSHGLLLAGAVIVGTITDTGPICAEQFLEGAQTPRSRLDCFKALLIWHFETYPWLIEKQSGSDAAKVKEMYWRTCIMDYTTSLPDLTPVRAEANIGAYFDHFYRVCESVNTAIPQHNRIDEESALESLPTAISLYERQMELTTWGRRLCCIEGGLMGLVPGSATTGDEICVFLGVPIPFVVRRQVGPFRTLVGSCYVHDMMDGQAMSVEGLQSEIIFLL